MRLSDLVVALLWATLAAVPLGISLWALLDAARRPQWAWALAGRRQVVWMAAIMLGTLFGLVVVIFALVLRYDPEARR